VFRTGAEDGACAERLATKVKSETPKRREFCEKAGLGFKLPIAKVATIQSKGKEKQHDSV
jgi:hypothetical protein